MKENTIKSSGWLIAGISQEKLKSEKILSVISAKIQLKRLALSLDQKQFAKLLGVTQGMVSRWESGTYNFTITTLVNICEKLRLSFEPSIIGEEPETIIEDAHPVSFHFSCMGKGDFNDWTPKLKIVSEGDAA